MITIKNQQQIEDFTQGCCFYATGGGGDPVFGQKMLLEALNAGKEIKIIDPNEVSEDVWTVCPYLMGPAPGPVSDETHRAMKHFGLTSEMVSNMPAAAVKLLLKLEKIQLSLVIPLEIGAAATASAVATAAWLDIPTIDGDYAGRALPEVSQILPAIHNINMLPIASCDRYGNESIIMKSTGNAMTERVGKMLATASFELVGQAALLMQLKHLKSSILPNTLSKALSVGEAIRSGSLDAVLSLTQAKVIFSGKVVSVDSSVQDGYFVGDIVIEGPNHSQLKLWFKNEIILSWLNGQPYLASPDLITMIDENTLEPLIIGKINSGAKVKVLAMKSSNQFRTAEAMKVVGPKHFGSDEIFKTFEG